MTLVFALIVALCSTSVAAQHTTTSSAAAGSLPGVAFLYETDPLSGETAVVPKATNNRGALKGSI